jgi:DNA-binding PadR family transcriptional regulator
MELLRIEKEHTNYQLAAQLTFGVNDPSKNWKIKLFDLQILSLLASTPMSGYTLRKSFFSTFGVKISFGTIYPRLRYFEQLKVIKPVMVDRPSGVYKVQYDLTPKGRADLVIGLKSFREVLNMIEGLAHGYFSRTNTQGNMETLVTGSQTLELEI